MSKDQEQLDEEIPNIIQDTRHNVCYTKGRFFGKGGFAKCYEVFDPHGQVLAGKIVSKKLLVKSNQREKMTQEIAIHRSLKHRNVVGFNTFFEDNKFVYIVLELCRKRSMMELHKRRKAITEPETRFYMKQILEGVSYLHNQKIIHRDLKLGNLFLSDNFVVKIGDFGLAARIEFDGQRKRTPCGTPNYIAPEILNKNGHSFEVDVWSIGCIMYTLLVGKPPFETSTLKETYTRIKKVEYKLPATLKKPAAYMIKKMLLLDPIQRPTVKQLLDYEFFHDYCPSSLPASCLMTAPRFDSVTTGGFNSPRRKPLTERNMEENSPVIIREKISSDPKKMPHDPKMILPNPSPLRNIKDECQDHLKSLYGLLTDTLRLKTPTVPSNAEEMSDPAAQPVIWVSKWVDYSDKYGFGYQLNDDSSGVMFNDLTRIIMLANKKNVHYIERDGNEHYYTDGHTPGPLDKKMKLLSYFLRYMNEHLMKAGASIKVQESDQLARLPYLHQWTRTPNSVMMQLTNGTLQFNFMDHTKLILCPLMAAVTFIDVDKSFRTYRFSTIQEFGCSLTLTKALDYARTKIFDALKQTTVA
uniref:polo kinase n=1 Tax=Cacopsylla melanoneura TaxID=428564 RepID=A0A8D8X9N0_9HEMI